MGRDNSIRYIIKESYQGTKSVDEIFTDIITSEIIPNCHENHRKRLIFNI